MFASWNILNWNIRGINSKDKWLAISNKISESNCSIVCLQETKRETFDQSYLRNFCPARINKFDYVPSQGASGGILTVWNDSVFQGECLFKNNFSISIRFTSIRNNQSWILTNIYGPCENSQRLEFIDWFKNIQMPDSSDWIIVGDFNYIRYPHNGNRGSGDINNMLHFNDAIHSLALVEIPSKDRSFTWSNMQTAPLLEKLDWIFTSEHWTITFPNTTVRTLAKITSDHTPCCIEIGTTMPKSKIFRFEFFWLEHQDFKKVVKDIWDQPIQEEDSAKIITTKFKRLRKRLKIWSKNISNLASTIKACNEVIHMWDFFEEYRPLIDIEHNGREILKEHLAKTLEYQGIYWKQRATIRWVKFEKESSHFFQNQGYH